LTREDVLAMPAGPALDVLVAERVMGWQWWKSRETGRRALFRPESIPEWFTARAEGTEELCRDTVANGGAVALPALSAYAGPAWRVVEILRERLRHHVIVNDFPPRGTFEVHAQDQADHEAGAPWWGYQVILERGPDRRAVWASGDTLPLAICRAALLTTLEPES
jgi:hypothetical protein